MKEIVRRFLRQRFGSIGSLIAFALIGLLTGGGIAIAGRASDGSFAALWIAWILLGGGIVSREARSGSLQMILARPIRRTEYLFGRYAGFVAGAAAVILASIVLGALVHVLVPPLFGQPVGFRIDVASVAREAASTLLAAALTGAILLFFSTFLPGYSDLMAYLGMAVFLTVPQGFSGQFQPIADAARLAKDNLMPRVPWAQVLAGNDPLRESVGRFALALAFYLVAAAWIFSRREFSYGQD